jgi:hypothetical protein
MTVQLYQPYKIIQRKQKRYGEHYNIPAVKCVIVPIKQFGDDLSCDVHWEDSEGKMQHHNQLFFNNENIEPLDAMKDFQLHEIWENYYQSN